MNQGFLDFLLIIVRRVDSMTCLKTHFHTEEKETQPYQQSYWSSLDTGYQKLIINDLYSKNCKDLISFIDLDEKNKHEKVIFSEQTGEILLRTPCDFKVESKIFKLENPICSLSNTDKVDEYFKTYQHLVVSVDPMNYSITKKLSSSAIAYLEFLLTRVVGKNYCLIITREIVEAVGKNKYRKSKQELCSKGLLRDVRTKLPKGINIVQVNPLLMYRGRSIAYDPTPMWNWFNRSGAAYTGYFRDPCI